MQKEKNLLDVAWDINTDGDLFVAGAIHGHLARISTYDRQDFDDLVYETGYYPSSSAPSVAGCTNYPINETGVLEVASYMTQNATTGAWWGFAWQTYKTYTDKIYTRAYYSSSGFTQWKLR